MTAGGCSIVVGVRPPWFLMARLLIAQDESLVAWNMGFHRPFRVRGPPRSGLTLKRSTWPSEASPHGADLYMRAICRSESTLKSALIIGLAGSLRVVQAYVQQETCHLLPQATRRKRLVWIGWGSSAIRVKS